mgnify:CR=1 FL=1|jgi:hypothetical protein
MQTDHAKVTRTLEPASVEYADRDLAILWCIRKSNLETGEGPKKSVMIAELAHRWAYTCGALRRMKLCGLVERVSGSRESWRLTEAGRLRLYFSVAVVATDNGANWAVVGHSKMSVADRIEAAGDLLGEGGTLLLQPIEVLDHDRRRVSSPRNLPKVRSRWKNPGQLALEVG